MSTRGSQNASFRVVFGRSRLACMIRWSLLTCLLLGWGVNGAAAQSAGRPSRSRVIQVPEPIVQRWELLEGEWVASRDLSGLELVRHTVCSTQEYEPTDLYEVIEAIEDGYKRMGAYVVVGRSMVEEGTPLWARVCAEWALEREKTVLSYDHASGTLWLHDRTECRVLEPTESSSLLAASLDCAAGGALTPVTVQFHSSNDVVMRSAGTVILRASRR